MPLLSHGCVEEGKAVFLVVLVDPSPVTGNYQAYTVLG